jgi:hypothetical protein
MFVAAILLAFPCTAIACEAEVDTFDNRIAISRDGSFENANITRCTSEKSEFELYPNLKSRLDLEKNSIYFLEANSITDAFAKYKEVNKNPYSPLSSSFH